MGKDSHSIKCMYSMHPSVYAIVKLICNCLFNNGNGYSDIPLATSAKPNRAYYNRDKCGSQPENTPTAQLTLTHTHNWNSAVKFKKKQQQQHQKNRTNGKIANLF